MYISFFVSCAFSKLIVISQDFYYNAFVVVYTDVDCYI